MVHQSMKRTDASVIMPNHFHGIIIMIDDGGGILPRIRRGVLQYTPTKFRSPSATVGVIVRGFKSTTTKQINQICPTLGILVWQRNYY